MKRLIMPLLLVSAFVGLAPTGHAQVQYVKVCSLYGAAFHYIPGTDICINDFTGDTRQQTEGGTWRSLLPYPEGKWVKNPQAECAPGKVVQVGNFKSTDFTLNPYDRKQTTPITLPVDPSEMITKVMMSGGFYDPRLPGRSGTNGPNGICLRSIDPNVSELQGSNVVNPPYGDGMLPIGCVANSRIVNMPATYAISATAAYPQVDAYFNDASQTVAGPYVYGSQLVVTTDIGAGGANLLTYFDSATQTNKPLAGTLSVSVCVQ